MTTTDMQAKFHNVSCSQCGRDFGPGNSGFSDCRRHAFRDWLYREGCLLDEPTKDQCIDAQRRAFEAALASRPDAQDDERGAFQSRASLTRMLNDACADMGFISEALGIDPEEAGGAVPILDAIEELKTKAGIGAEAAQGVADEWKLVPVKPTAEMLDAGLRHIPALHVWNAMLAAAPSPDREQVGEAPEGCTPADAEMLRAANHSLAAENDRLRRRLRPFAQLASSSLSWAMVEYCIADDPEKQTLQAPQMQRAFNRAADVLRENIPPHEPIETDLDLPDWVKNAKPPSADASPSRECADSNPPFSNCSFRICDLPGQCRAEGECHHPKDKQPRECAARAPMLSDGNIAEEAARIADSFTCGTCGMDGKAGARIRQILGDPMGSVTVQHGLAPQPQAAEPKGLTDEQREAIRVAADTAHRVLCAGGDYGDELSDAGLRRDLKAARDQLRVLLAAKEGKS